jgi:hypothetical protein
MTKMVVPRIKFDINKDNPLDGVKTISLVDEPAIESYFIFFNKKKPQYVELKKEGYKQCVAGLILRGNYDILRYDALGLPYYGYFTTESIEAIRDKFHKENLGNRVNTDHNSENYVDAYLIEDFIINSEERLADVRKQGFKEAEIGDWYGVQKIDNSETFARILAGELRGFSVEIFIDNNFSASNAKTDDELMKIILESFRALATINNKLNKIEEVKMNKNFIQKFKEMLSELEGEDNTPVVEEVKFEQAKDADGKTIEYGKVGEPVNVISVDASGVEVKEPAKDGELVLDNGKTVVVASGVLAEIKDSAEAPVEQAAEPAAAEKHEAVNAEFEAVKAELAAMKSEVEKLKKENGEKTVEIVNLKKASIAKPVADNFEKPNEVDFNKLSPIDKIRHKNGLLNKK